MSLIEYTENRKEMLQQLWEDLVAFRMMEDLTPIEKSVIDAAKYVVYEFGERDFDVTE